DAVPDGRRIAVERPGEPDAGAAWLAPGDDGVALHHPRDAQLAANGVIEFRGALQIVGAERDVADHEPTPYSRRLWLCAETCYARVVLGCRSGVKWKKTGCWRSATA